MDNDRLKRVKRMIIIMSYMHPLVALAMVINVALFFVHITYGSVLGAIVAAIGAIFGAIGLIGGRNTKRDLKDLKGRIENGRN